MEGLLGPGARAPGWLGLTRTPPNYACRPLVYMRSLVFGGFALPLRPPSPSCEKPVEPPPLGRHRGGSLRCVKKGAALRGVIAMVVGLAAATRRRHPYPSSEQRTPHQNSDSEAMAAQVSRFDPARLLSFVHADLERH